MPFANAGDNNNMGQVGDTPGIDQWFKSLPILTRYWFGATVVLTLSVNFNVLSGYYVMWSWASITEKFEIYRFITPFCYAGGFSFNTLIACYMLVQFSKKYETGGPFNTGAGGGTADYAFCLLLGMAMMLATYPLILGFFPLPPLFCHNMIYYVLYVWSKRNPTAQANIWGIPMQGIYLPFAYLMLTVFMGNPYIDMLHGLAIGHIYYFFVDVIPVVYGKDIVQTPKFLIDYFGVGEYQAPPVAAPPQRFGGIGGLAGGGSGGPGAGGGAAAPRRGGGHTWGGGGQRLGTN